MRSILSIVVFVLALAALLSPSVAVGVRTLTVDRPAVTVSVVADAGIELASPCAQQGGTRVLPCQADLGALFGVQSLAAASTAVVVYFIGDEVRRPSALSARTLPPPRRA